MIRRSVILGCGSYLPKTIVTNDDLAKRIDTSDEWIVQRTGIKRRHVAGPDEKTSDLATAAARAALASAKLDTKDIDLIVVATATPDNTFPATATRVQANLGVAEGFCVRCAGGVFRLCLCAGDGG